MKSKIFQEIIEERVRAQDVDSDDDDDENPEEEAGGGITPSSCDKRMIAIALSAIQDKSHNTFLNFIRVQNNMVSEMFRKMRGFSTLICLNDKSLNIKPKEDMVVSRLDMTGYYVWASIIKYWHRIYSRMFKGVTDKNERAAYESIAGVVYRLIFQKANGSVNEGFDYKRRSNCFKIVCCCRCKKRKYVNSLWDRIDSPPIAPYAAYHPRHTLWRQYQINERKVRSPFRSMDRIKLLNNIVLDQINVFELQFNDLIESFFPLHDRYILYGEPKEQLFEEFPAIAGYADPPEIAEKKEAIFTMMSGMEDQADASDFLGNPLLQALGCKIYDPVNINIELIQNYFGEKVALYFEYLKFHTRSLKWVSFIGIISFILDLFLLYDNGIYIDYSNIKTNESPVSEDGLTFVQKKRVAFKMNRLILGVVMVIWSTLYLEYWRRRQQYYAIFYGMSEFENSENKRPSFEGNFVRDLATNAFNILTFSNWKRNLKKIVIYLVVILIVGISVGFSFLALYIKGKIALQHIQANEPEYEENRSVFLIYGIPGLINFLGIKLIDFYFQKIAVYFNKKENHETLTKYEDSLINKVFIFNFLNLFNSFFIIGFVKEFLLQRKIANGEDTSVEDNLLFHCYNTGKNFREDMSCYNEMEGQTWTFFVLAFILNFFEIIIPILSKSCRKKFLGLPRKYQWGKVDEIIENEYHRNSYQATVEVDGVVYDYSEVTNQFALLSFFGTFFPLGYFISYMTSISEIYIDMYNYLNYLRRPIPRSTSDIGNWQFLLEGVSFLTIFINSAIIIFTTQGIREVHFVLYPGDIGQDIDLMSLKIRYFVFLIFVFLLLKLFLGLLISDTPWNIKLIMARHKNIVEKTINTSAESLAFSKAGVPVDLAEAQLQMLTDAKGKQGGKKDKEANEGSKASKSVALSKKPIPPSGNNIKETIGYKPEDFNVD